MSPAARSLISLLVILLSAGAVALSVRLQPAPPPPPRDQVEPIFDFPPDQVVAISIASPAGKLQAERVDGLWQVRLLEREGDTSAAPGPMPSEAVVDQEVQALVDRIVGLPEVNRFPRDDRPLSAFGLDDPEAMITLGLDGGTTRSLEVGDRTTTGAGLYARAAPPDDILQIGSLILSDIGASYYQLRALAKPAN